MRNVALRGAAAALAALALGGCGESEKSSRGLDYMPDMYESPAYRSQQTMQVVIKDGVAQPRPVMSPSSAADGQMRHVPAMLTPPAGTVPRDFLPYPFAANDFSGPHDLRNPYAPTPEVMRRGQRYYNIACAVCHGNDGNANNGYVAKQFSGIPSVNGANLALLTDGDIYHIISAGRNRMPNYRAQLLPENRWAVVAYVRVLNRATLAVTDADAALAAAADELKAKPDDAAAKAAFDAAKSVAATAKADLELIKRGGDGAAFRPAPEAVPEYVTPTWPEN
jgi:mono/diheme cytochrome c family protein